eukprot:462855-Prorocentrum_minimum.AAC.1
MSLPHLRLRVYDLAVPLVGLGLAHEAVRAVGGVVHFQRVPDGDGRHLRHKGIHTRLGESTPASVNLHPRLGEFATTPHPPR